MEAQTLDCLKLEISLWQEREREREREEKNAIKKREDMKSVAHDNLYIFGKGKDIIDQSMSTYVL